jgi:polyphosphate kinase 2 (PPK2 family)
MASREHLDLSLSLGSKEQDARLEAAGERLMALRLALGGMIPFGDGERRLGPALCLVFEGWDASGKGGAIKRLTAALDPRHVRYASYAAPTPDEKRHHYLQRFWGALPGRGGMTVFDRSWYGRVMVERVEGFASTEEWKRAYDEINGFERALTDDGMLLAKFWLEVSDAEQLKRFEKRKDEPLKAYKLTDEDWRNREKRAAYEEAIDEMLERTDTPHAPWILVEGDSKKYARVKVIESVVAFVEDGLRRQGIEPPAPLG